MEVVCAVLAGFLLDCLFGDPHWLPHPVCLMGSAYAKGEKLLRRLFPKTHCGAFWGGALLCILVVSLSLGIPLLILWLAGLVSQWLAFALHCLFCYQILAARSLRDESRKVYLPLKQGNLSEARKMLSYIVGRDTGSLNEEQVAKAAVETVAENTSDGVIAPLFFLLLGGAPLGFAYKAVNTADSMIGYKNDRYLYFGRFAARLDDLCNWIPARLSGIFMVLSAFFIGLDGKNALRIYRRDRRNHASPNSAQTESACAGALNIQLAGDASYFGTIVHKPTIGDPIRRAEPEDILRSHRLLYGTSLLCLLVFCGIRSLFILL